MTRVKLLAFMALIFPLMAKTVSAQTISNQTTVSFGQLVVGGVGTATVPSSSDTRTSTGLVALVGTALVQRGSFDVTFTPGAQVIITIPGTIPMTGANTPNFTPTLEGGTIQTIPIGGVLTVYIGGTISFTTSGSYGSTDVNVTINVDPF
jgi:hypothetical protein